MTAQRAAIQSSEREILDAQDVCRLLRVSPRKLRSLLSDAEARFPQPFTLPNTRRHLWIAADIYAYVAATAGKSIKTGLDDDSLVRVA